MIGPVCENVLVRRLKDGQKRRLDLLLDDAELEVRRRKLGQLKPPPTRGYARLFHHHVLQADQGCDFDFLR